MNKIILPKPNIKLPSLPEKKAETWQLKKLELAEGILRTNEHIIKQNDKMITLLREMKELMQNAWGEK